MASRNLREWKPQPKDLYPHRGQYGSKFWAATFSLSTQLLLVVLAYSLLVPPKSPWSIFSHFSHVSPFRPPPTDAISLPGIPDLILRILENAFCMSSYNSLVFLSMVTSSIEFALYNTLWRREIFPMIGQGGALSVSIRVQMVDMIHILFFVYTASHNPTWSPSLFRWMPAFVVLFVVLQIVADLSKYLFKQYPRNDGKIYMSGVFSLVRHPNFLGFFIWRVAFAIECGGLFSGAATVVIFTNLSMQTSIPGLEG